MNPPQSLNTRSSSDKICVFLNNCHVDLKVGIYDSEMTVSQPVVINIELEAALPYSYDNLSEKTLDRVIDYERLHTFVTQEIPKLGHIYLLETIGDYIVSFCFKDPRVQHARVRLEKTKAFAGDVRAGIEIIRTREAHQS